MALFGKKGIDTSYERDLFERRVKLTYPEKDGGAWLPSDLMENIQRAREFSVSNVIGGYELLRERISVIMKHIESEMKNNGDFGKYKTLLETTGYKAEAIDVENANSEIRGHSFFELYGILFRLKHSIENQIDFQYNHYASQFIEGRSLEDLALAEENSISVLAQMQSDLYTDATDVHSHGNEDEIIQVNEFEQKQVAIQRNSLMHITNGDISYSHLNRQADLEVIVNAIENLVYYAKEMLDGNIELMIQKLHALDNKNAVKVQLLSQFSNIKARHIGSKSKYKTISSDVELYASEAAYAHKKIKEGSTDPLMSWLVDQSEQESRSFDQLAGILVEGVVNSERTYEKMNGSMTQLYKSESNYFANQVDFIQDKEKIRLYFRIIEDLEDRISIDGEWILEYLVTNGYRSSAEV